MHKTCIEYRIGDATTPTDPGNKIIAHVCNDIGAWGRGFVIALSKRWPIPEDQYRLWHGGRDGNDFALGALQLVQVESDIWVANMIGQHDIARAVAPGPAPVRYEAIASALQKLATEAAGLHAHVHMPRIGCGLAGGKWEMIEPIILTTLCAAGIKTFVYDLE